MDRRGSLGLFDTIFKDEIYEKIFEIEKFRIFLLWDLL